MKSGYILVATSSLFSAIASLLLKYGGKKSPEIYSHETNALIFYCMAILSYGCGFIFYAMALRQENVTHAYSTMVGITVILLFSWNMISGMEKIDHYSIIGNIFIIFGIFLTTTRAIK